MFNKFNWLEEQEQLLKTYIKESLVNDHAADASDLAEELNNSIDNEVIYYNNCWDICKAIAPNDSWDKLDLAPINSISDLAFAALYEYAYENINLEQLLEETYKEIDDAKY